MGRTVLFIKVPAGQGGDPAAMRDHVLESLDAGVLVLGKDVAWELVELPELGGGVVVSEHCTSKALPAPDRPAAFSGAGGKEKRETYNALVRFKQEHGLGCLRQIVKACPTDGVTESVLYSALSCEKLPLETWRGIGRALERLNQEAARGKTD